MQPEDLIKETLSEQKGLNSQSRDGVKDVEIPDLFEPEFIDFNDVKTWKTPKEVKKKVENWVTGDFVSYTRYIHYKRYNSDWDLNYRGACNELLKVRDDIVDTYGFCDNVVLKDCIDFFFEYWADYFINKSNGFLFIQMRNDRFIDKFAESYNYNQENRFKGSALEEGAIVSSEKNHIATRLEEQALESAYWLSLERLVKNYGVLVAINWLYGKHHFGIKSATIKVFEICQKLKDTPDWGKVKRSTEFFSPYPSWLYLSNRVHRFFGKIDPSAEIELEICEDNEKFQSLKEYILDNERQQPGKPSDQE